MSTYTFPTPPNPQVYRKAAEILDDGRSSHFSCFAISDAASALNLSRLESELCIAQYEAVFGPNHGVAPFAQNFTPERQQQRILALLFMADICENPT